MCAGRGHKDGAQALVIAYIHADDVAETLDTVVGPSNWRTQCQEITDAGVIAVRRSIAIRVGEEWIEKWDYGYPNSIVDGQVKDEQPLSRPPPTPSSVLPACGGSAANSAVPSILYGRLNERKRFAEPEKLRDEFWRRIQTLRRVSSGAQSDSGR